MRFRKTSILIKETGSFVLSPKRGLVRAHLKARLPDRCGETYRRGTIKEKQLGHSLHMQYIVKCSYFSPVKYCHGLCVSFRDSCTSSSIRASY